MPRRSCVAPAGCKPAARLPGLQLREEDHVADAFLGAANHPELDQNPSGIPSISPALRETSYAGYTSETSQTLKEFPRGLISSPIDRGCPWRCEKPDGCCHSETQQA